MHKQQGQTLIETVVAIFILVMGIVAAVGLAIFAQSSSSNITKQIIATGLAREGIEAIKNIRDTNWLSQVNIDTNCYNFASSTANNANCYKNWMDQNYYPNGSPLYRGSNLVAAAMNSPNLYAVGYSNNPSYPNYWLLYQQGTGLPTQPLDCNSATPYGLDYFSDPESDIDPNPYGLGFYRPLCKSHGTSDFYRKISVLEVNSGPYNTTVGRRLVVTSQVWWTDKKCPRATNWNLARPACRVEMVTYLTNWKTY